MFGKQNLQKLKSTGAKGGKKVSLMVKGWGPLGCLSRSPPVVDRRPVWPGPLGAAARDRRPGPFKPPLPLTKPQASAEEDIHY